MTPIIAAAAVTVSLMAATVSDSHIQDPAPKYVPRTIAAEPDADAERDHAEIMRRLDMLEKKL